jgi:hypothetical protein
MKIGARREYEIRSIILESKDKKMNKLETKF